MKQGRGRGGEVGGHFPSLRFFLLKRQQWPRDSLMGFLPGSPRSNSHARFSEKDQGAGVERGETRTEGAPLLYASLE